MLLYVPSSIAIILMGKRELIALLNLSSCCLVMVERPKSCSSCEVSINIINMSFNVICENEILVKISEFTVLYSYIFSGL